MVLKPKLVNRVSMGSGLSWVQLGKVNLKPSSIHLARQSEWTKVKVGLHLGL